MITLYQLQWSHYVEKVRWALDFKQIEWSAVDVDPFTKREMRHLKRRTALPSGSPLLVPMIHDHATDSVVADSSAILEYLDRTYPTPALYPADEEKHGEVKRWMLWLDSTLGLAGRRLAYTHIALEHPSYLVELFFPGLEGKKRKTLIGPVAGFILAGLVSRRFRCASLREDRVFETCEEALLLAARRLHERRFLVDNCFTAADLTLASLLHPIKVVPFFRAHPQLQRLFEWQEALAHAHGRNVQAGYGSALHEMRKRRGWALGSVRWVSASANSSEPGAIEVPPLKAMHNDQQPLGSYAAIRAPVWFIHLMLTSGLERTPYP